MPVLDGLAATHAIRALPGARGATPIIALTANVQADHVRRCHEAGMDGHVGKPIKIHELVQAIARAMQIAEGDEAGPVDASPAPAERGPRAA